MKKVLAFLALSALIITSLCLLNAAEGTAAEKSLTTPQTYIFTNQSNVNVKVSINGQKCIDKTSWSGGWIEPQGKRYVEIKEKGKIFSGCGWTPSWIEFKITNPDGSQSNNGHVKMSKPTGNAWSAVKCQRDHGDGFRLNCTGIDVFIIKP